jgi:V8-like Glu-specific endopeptidase
MLNAFDWSELDEYLDVDGYDAGEAQDVDYSVIGPTDGRFQVRAQDRAPSTRLFPYNTICFLQTSRGSTGTGTLIAPQVVLTAGHVLSNGGTPVASVRVTAGADLSAATEARRRPGRPGSVVVPGARIRLHPRRDLAVAILPRAVTSPNRFMLLQPRGDRNTATLLTVAGYPCDKPLGTLWAHSDRVRLADLTVDRMSYRMDTCPGHSGGPIWLLGNAGTRILLGVHTDGAGDANTRCPTQVGAQQWARNGAPVRTSTGLNSGERVNCDAIRFIEGVARAFRVRVPAVDRAQFRRACP